MLPAAAELVERIRWLITLRWLAIVSVTRRFPGLEMQNDQVVFLNRGRFEEIGVLDREDFQPLIFPQGLGQNGSRLTPDVARVVNSGYQEYPGVGFLRVGGS